MRTLRPWEGRSLAFWSRGSCAVVLGLEPRCAAFLVAVTPLSCPHRAITCTQAQRNSRARDWERSGKETVETKPRGEARVSPHLGGRRSKWPRVSHLHSDRLACVDAHGHSCCSCESLAVVLL